MITPYLHPKELDRSDCYKVSINGVNCDILRVPFHEGEQADVVICACDGPVDIVVQYFVDCEQIKVQPSHLGLTAECTSDGFHLQIPKPRHLIITLPGQPQLFLLLAEELAAPAADAIRFATGQVHEVGELELEAGQEIWIEGGAVVRGAIRARGPGCKIRGHGILDGSCFDPKTARRRTLILDECHGGIVEGICIINPSSWSCVLGACDDALVRDLRVFGDVICSDGIDLVGCRNTIVENCMLATNDDCVAIKSLDIRGHAASTQIETDHSWARDIKNIEIRDCVLLNGPGGNGIEIGGETTCESIDDVRWHDIDILCAHGQGAPISIRVCDRARVSNIHYKNIRIEQHWDLLLRLRVLRDSYATDKERGHLSNVTLCNIDVAQEACNIGNTVALIGGHDDEHRVNGVHFDNFILAGNHITNPHQMQLFTRAADNITFK